MYKVLLKSASSRNSLNYVFSKNCYHSAGAFGYKGKPEDKFAVAEDVLESRSKESNFYRLVTAFRQYAHHGADINPIALNKLPDFQPQLEPKRYGFNKSDRVNFKNIINIEKPGGTIEEALQFLDEAYRKHISVEFLHLDNEEEIEWFSHRIELIPRETVTNETKIRVAKALLKSQTFDNFLANKFPGLKRYGGEGAESMMAFFYEFFNLSSLDTIEDVVIGMPHRGRLNVLTGMLQVPPVKLFAKLRGLPDFPEKIKGTGDVLSHCISSTDLNFQNNKSIHVSLLYNPSHLEAVNPVSLGKTRAKQMSSKDGDYSETGKWSDKVLNLQIHGDAAFIGQGINQECLALCRTPNFEVGGTIHLIVNNQLGFTTPAEQGRSSVYTTDLAKMISSPIIHVNGDDPEAVLKATRVAFEYQRKFRKDIFIDMNCFRQWGHNELDDPTFTNPRLYKIIRSRDTVPNQYVDKLQNLGILYKEEVKNITDSYYEKLNEHLKAVESFKAEDPCFTRQWEGFEQAQAAITTWDTGLEESLLSLIGKKSVTYPSDFNVHSHLLKTHVNPRLAKIAEGNKIDWSTAESLALGSLLYQGYNVRLCGQDVGRGTFSHRHAMLVDQESNNIHIPLNEIDPAQVGRLEVANSILSEEAVLGYEYGMSVENPYNLIIWEAQFGDFFNGAQIIFDTFIASGETKWLWSSGLVVMLPHGYDGAGPEHSSSRIERFLQLTDSKENAVDGDNVNMQVCQPSTPAQYYHLLRRQMVRNFRKPLIIIAPKTLLRLPAATSSFADMTPGTSFLPVIGKFMIGAKRTEIFAEKHFLVPSKQDGGESTTNKNGDTTTSPESVTKVIVSSGKHYYNLLNHKESTGIQNVALVRLESFCPFPTAELMAEINRYPNASIIIWSQEEPRNMGVWTFIKPRFENLVGKQIKYCGREALAAPAVGIGKLHQEQAAEVINKPFTMDGK